MKLWKEMNLNELQLELEAARADYNKAATEASSHLEIAHRGLTVPMCHTCNNKAMALSVTQLILDRLEGLVREFK